MVASFIGFMILDPNPMKVTDAQTYSSVQSHNQLLYSCDENTCASEFVMLMTPKSLIGSAMNENLSFNMNQMYTGPREKKMHKDEKSKQTTLYLDNKVIKKRNKNLNICKE
jgi:hypothetical protein